MAEGTLIARIEPSDKMRYHYGTRVPVTGIVELKYISSEQDSALAQGLTQYPGNYSQLVDITYPGGSDAIVAQLRVEVVLRGTLSLANIPEPGRASDEGLEIFSQSLVIHDGLFSATPGSKHYLPFSVPFANSSSQAYDTPTSSTRTSICPESDQSLPDDAPFKNWPPSKDTLSPGPIHVRYRVEIKVSAPDSHTRILNHGPQIVCYDFPRQSRGLANSSFHSFEQRFVVRSAQSSSKSTEAVQYAFLARCYNIPKHAYGRHILDFNFSIFLDLNRSTTTTVPQIILRLCKVTFVMRSTVGNQSSLNTIWTSRSVPTPFGRFTAEHNYTKTIRTDGVVTGTSSFRYGNVELSYLLRFDVKLVVDDHPLFMTSELPIVLHPPLLEDIETA